LFNTLRTGLPAYSADMPRLAAPALHRAGRDRSHDSWTAFISSPSTRPAAVEAGGFAAAMTQALKSVSAQQEQAQQMQREVQLDNPTVSLEQTMIAMQKGQIGFQAALQVRNQLVRAYTDIMSMPV